jgi:hypothetical protein
MTDTKTIAITCIFLLLKLVLINAYQIKENDHIKTAYYLNKYAIEGLYFTFSFFLYNLF